MVADLVTCIRANLDCSDVCVAAGPVLSRHTGDDANLTRAVLDSLHGSVQGRGDECERHASMHEHCRVRAESAAAVSRPAGTCSTASGIEGMIHMTSSRLRPRVVGTVAALVVMVSSLLAPVGTG